MVDDKRPDVWIGHISMKTQVLDLSETFMK